ncbi:MAG TPA: PepSY domain-containing protein [Blastocatellia bacterium]|nr:PepSY domain-containing protein [Blastocatellia bacterium]
MIILLHAILMIAAAFNACASPGQIGVNTPEGRIQNYPPVIEDTPQRRQEAQDAWKKFITEFQIPASNIELEPVLNIPRALPPELAGRIVLQTNAGPFGELEAKEALRRFIERSSGVLFPNHASGSLGLKDISLISFSNDGNFYRAVYHQANYAFPIANGYGELRLTAGKNGTLLQWGSRIIPVFDLPTRAEIAPPSIVNKMVGREFIYSNIAGQSMSYKIANRSEISVKGLVVYPKQEGNKITIHLAYPVEVGGGMTWTVYVDAITGQEIDVKQNFAS